MRFSLLLFFIAFLLGGCDFSQGVQRNYIISHTPQEETLDGADHEEAP